MVDGLRLSQYLRDTELKIQEFWFLYSVMCVKNNYLTGSLTIPLTDDSQEVNENIDHYFNTKTPDINSPLKWSEVAYKLEDCGWLDIYHQAKQGELKIENCEVTEKFKSIFLISDVSKAFYEFANIYPRYIDKIRNQTSQFTTFDLPPHELIALYNDLILRQNNRVLHERCLLITSLYIKSNQGGTPYKMSTYLRDKYEGIAFGIEQDARKEDDSRSETGRRKG